MVHKKPPVTPSCVRLVERNLVEVVAKPQSTLAPDLPLFKPVKCGLMPKATQRPWFIAALDSLSAGLLQIIDM
jgi:hypothetical protein